MRTFIKFFGCILVILTGVLLWNTYQLKSQQLTGIAPVDGSRAGDSAIVNLSRAIRFKTISSQDSSRLDSSQFRGFISFLENTYPLVHRRLQREEINTFAMLYQWPGKNPALRPLLLMGHYDVVPVLEGMEITWKKDPFSGDLEDGYLYGRGSLDDKSTVLGILESVEYLLRQNFQPERTVYLSFGHDEEVSGRQGAGAIARLLEQRGVKLEMVLDEGGIIKTDGVAGLSKAVALVGVAEKGYLSLQLTARGEGGHSSMPPEKTSIGILASALDKLQQNPFPSTLKGTVGQMLRYLGPEMPFVQRLAIANQWLLGPILINTLRGTNSGAASIHTTMAPTILKAGVKDNVLPGEATAIVNFRILPGDSISGVIRHVREVLDDSEIEITPLSEFNEEPSPVSPPEADAFRVLHRTIKSCYPQALVAPYLMLGASDSRYFSRLSENIYRFTPYQINDEDLKRIHGTNERIQVDTYHEMIQFYTTLIENMAGKK